MANQLVELFEVAKKAADAATAEDIESNNEEIRCLDALKELKDFPVNYHILVSTQLLQIQRGVLQKERLLLKLRQLNGNGNMSRRICYCSTKASFKLSWDSEGTKGNQYKHDIDSFDRGNISTAEHSNRQEN